MSSRWLVRLVAPVAILVAVASSGGVRIATSTAQAPMVTPVLDFRPSGDWAPDPPGATARSYVLIDANTGQELAAREAEIDVPVASTVKLLTVLTALARVELDDVVTMGDEVLVGEAGVGLMPGDQWTVRQLVEGIIVRSGNDAARALAVHVAGDIDAFVALMQQDAAELGIEAEILEPDGLEDLNMLSASDLAIVGRAALAVPALAEIADLETVDLPGLGRVTTRNVLLLDRPEVTGLKTGFTTLAGYCLVSSMTTEDGRELIAVVLGSFDDGTRFEEAEDLLDFGEDDLIALGLIAGARLRVPGGWIEGTEILDISVPFTPPPVVQAEFGPDGMLLQRILTGGAQVATSMTSLPTAPTSDAGVGAALADRLYRVMREAHARNLWEETVP